jgi:hypothetical protein
VSAHRLVPDGSRILNGSASPDKAITDESYQVFGVPGNRVRSTDRSRVLVSGLQALSSVHGVILYRIRWVSMKLTLQYYMYVYLCIHVNIGATCSARSHLEYAGLG